MGLFVGAEGVRGAGPARLFEPVDGGVVAGGEEEFFGLVGGLVGGGRGGGWRGGWMERWSGHLFRIHEAHLARRHGGVLVQVRPGRVDDRDVVFLIAWRAARVSGLVVPAPPACLCCCARTSGKGVYVYRSRCRVCAGGVEGGREPADRPSIEFALVSCAHSSTSSFGSASHVCSGVRRR